MTKFRSIKQRACHYEILQPDQASIYKDFSGHLNTSMTLLEDLKNQIAKGQAIVIVGAGVSIGATHNKPCASWTGLLHHGVDRCVEVAPGLPANWAQRVHAEIDSSDLDDLLSAAEKIATKLGAPKGGEYRRWLRESVGVLRAGQREVIAALQGLGTVLATTNYDNLLEEITGLPPVTWMDGARVERVARGDEPGVLHLHGHWQRPESVILGIRSYEQVLGDAHAQTLLRALQTLKTLLFVGCGEGLHDPNFGKLLEWTGQVFAQSEYRRFRLAREDEVATLQQQHPAEQRLFVLSYGKQHADLAPFLRSLGAARSRQPPPAVAAPILLPARPRCIGRDQEVALLVGNWLADPPEPTPILGPPGIGKSTLTLAAMHAAKVAARYGERRYFIRCDGVQARAALVAKVADALGLPLAPNIEPAVLAALARAPTVLALDNLETPWEADTLAVEEWLTLLAAVPGLALVVSLRGKQRPYGVDWNESLQPPALTRPVARQVFLAVAGKQFEQDLYLDKLVAAADGVPLALTLLACAAEGEPNLAGLWHRWEQERTAMLKRADGRDRLTNIELSYEISLTGPRMTAAGRRLLSLLALLPEGLAHNDISTVLPDQGEAAAAVLRQTGLAFDEAERLRLLAPLREYIRRRYPPEPDDRERLLAHFVGLAANLADKVGGKGGAEAVQRLAPEAANMETLLLLGLESGHPAEVISAAYAWGEFIRFTGVGSARPIDQAAQVAETGGDLQSAANCIWRLGNIALARSDHAEARRRYEAALPLYRQVGAVLGEANCIQGLGDIALAQSDRAGAQQHFAEALVLYERFSDPYSIGAAHWRLARLTEGAERNHHVQAARTAWESIDRPDLVQRWLEEFGAGG